MKQRLLIMNEQKILQNFTNKGWETTGLIKKAEVGIKPGIYNIYSSKEPSDKIQYEGKILLVDKDNGVFYQQVKKDFIVHQLNAVNVKPVAGKDVVVRYDGDKAILTQLDALRKKRILKI